jgi:hypothetical protein
MMIIGVEHLLVGFVNGLIPFRQDIATKKGGYVLESSNIALSILASALAAAIIYIVQTNRADLKEARDFWYKRFDGLQELITKLIAEVAEMKGRLQEKGDLK